MTNFETLNDMFEKGKDFYKMFNQYGDEAIRYAMLRSLDNQNIEEFLGDRIDTSSKKNLLKNAYNSNVTIEETEDYIMSKKDEILEKRRFNEEYLLSIVEKMDIVNCGIRNDRVDDIIKPFVRNKNFTSLEEMTTNLDNNLVPRIRNYVYWSYFNQLSNDLIENSFYSHPSIIPTLRKIHDIDFFIKIDNRIIPFDLKITHISDEFFDKYSEGLISSDSNDSFISNEDENEMQIIKNIYKKFKNDFNLPNYSKLSKIELLTILKEQNNDKINNNLTKIYENRSSMIDDINNNITTLEWWNYKYQGERLFSNNNRFFVFLAHKNSFEDGKDLKKNIIEIRDKIKNRLDNLTFADVHTIRYIYKKDPKFNGNYLINCVSILIAKE